MFVTDELHKSTIFVVKILQNLAENTTTLLKQSDFH